MNYSHDNWSAILAHIGKPEELDTSARNALLFLPTYHSAQKGS
ncbi:hypothetical protein, partial [Escherichia coli]